MSYDEILFFLEEHKNDAFPNAVFPASRGVMGVSSSALKAGLRGERRQRSFAECCPADADDLSRCLWYIVDHPEIWTLEDLRRMASMAPQWEGIVKSLVPLMQEFLLTPTLIGPQRSVWVRQIMNREVDLKVSGGTPSNNLSAFQTVRNQLLQAAFPEPIASLILQFVFHPDALAAARILSSPDFMSVGLLGQRKCLRVRRPSAGVTNTISELTNGDDTGKKFIVTEQLPQNRGCKVLQSGGARYLRKILHSPFGLTITSDS